MGIFMALGGRGLRLQGTSPTVGLMRSSLEVLQRLRAVSQVEAEGWESPTALAQVRISQVMCRECEKSQP